MRVKPTGLKLHSVGNEAFTYETPPEHIRLHTAMLAVAKARSGKSFLLTGILSQLKKAGCMDRILVISDTFDSNRTVSDAQCRVRGRAHAPNGGDACVADCRRRRKTPGDAKP